MPILGNQPPGRPQGENKWEFKGNNNGLKQFKGNNNGLKRPLLATLGLRLTPPGVQSRDGIEQGNGRAQKRRNL